MMYKRVLAFLLLLILAAGFLPVKAKASSSEYKDAEILIVYNNNPTKDEIEGIQTIVKILTYLQHSTVFLTMDESIEVLEHYDNVICYGLHGDLGRFMELLAKMDHNVLLMGSEGVEDYVKSQGYPLRFRSIPSAIATVKYRFSETNEFDALISKQDIILLDGELTYQNGSISVKEEEAGLYSGYHDFLYLPISDMTEALIQASFIKEVAQWLWPYKGEPHAYAQYIVLDEVYPFTPPEKLLEIVDYLIKYRLPFVISVMPIYQNGEYPAMQRFCDVLRYAQANGGAIIMHAPTIIKDKDNVTQIQKYLTIGTEAYTNLGVYPLGIEVPENHMFEETSRILLQRYSTVFFYQDQDEVALNLEEQFNIIYKDGHKMVGPAIGLVQTGESMTKVHATAMYLDIYEGFEAIKKKIDTSIQSNIPLKSLWDTDCTVYADGLYFYTEQGQLYVNDKKTDIAYEPVQYDDNFDYQSTVFHWIAKDLKGLNRKLIIFVLIASVVFIGFIIKARKLNRDKFLLPKEGGESK